MVVMTRAAVSDVSGLHTLITLKLEQDDFEGETLPRGLPYVGFRRHAPPLPPGQREGRPAPSKSEEVAESQVATRETTGVTRSSLMLKLLRESPYVGFCPHAPPSPTLNFARCSLLLSEGADLLSPLAAAPEGEALAEAGCSLLPGGLPEGIWASILSRVVDVPAILRVSRVRREFPALVRHACTWEGARVRVPPEGVSGLAPHLHAWLASWRLAARLVVPRSTQLLAEVARVAPDLPVEVAWRFDSRAKGEGLQVIRCGAAVKRVEDDEEDVDEVVVLGDAPVITDGGRAPYVEVRLDILAEATHSADDNVNDFGIGFTACEPEGLDLEEHFAVASEVPHSWVVDFAQSAVCLNVNNCLEAKGYCACSGSLQEGDRVGVQISNKDQALEVFINGELRERLLPASGRTVPEGARLFPVVDLYGRVAQISCTGATTPGL